MLTKPTKIGFNGKIILCWSIFYIELVANICLFLGYWRSKNVSRNHSKKGEFVSLRKPIVLCTIGKKILCWSIFALEAIADSCPFLIYWPSKNESRYHDVKGEPISLTKPTVFGITRKKILCESKFAIEPIAAFCQFRRYWSSKNGSRDYNIKYEFVSLEKTIVFCITGNKSFI